MKWGIVLPQAEITDWSGAQLIKFCSAAEQAGFDHLLAYDHIVGTQAATRPGWTGPYDLDTPFLEALVLFGYLLGVTSLDLLTDIVVLPQRNTLVLAKQVSTLAAISPGRLRLGVGVGYDPDEFASVGSEFTTRGSRFTEQLELLHALQRQRVVNFTGRWHTVRNAGIWPLPTPPVPVWVGSGEDPRALDRVARFGDGWLPAPAIQPGAGFELAWAHIRDQASAVGRDPDELGFEGQLRLTTSKVDLFHSRVEGWRAVGASAIGVNLMGNGVSWPDGHIELLESVAPMSS